jgi:hypothetical protein
MMQSISDRVSRVKENNEPLTAPTRNWRFSG